MAHQIRSFQVPVPANTPIAAPIRSDVSFPAMHVDSIKWRVPRGTGGQVGWRLTSGGAQVLPHNIGGWIVANGEADSWNLEGLHDSGMWEVTAYNTHIFPHTITMTFVLSIIRRKWEPVTLFSAEELAPVPDLSGARPVY